MEENLRRKILAGARLRNLRSELAMSQSAMAVELGISVSYLNLVERNQRPVTAQLLIKLSETYGVDPSSFAQAEEMRSTAELEEVFADALFQANPISRNDIRLLSETVPTVGAAVSKLYAAYAKLLELQSLHLNGVVENDRSEPSLTGIDDPIENVRAFLQRANNHFPELEAAADQINLELVAIDGLQYEAIIARLMNRHDVRVQIMPISVMGKTLRRFDMHRKKIMLSELIDPSGRLFQVAFHLGLLELGHVFERLTGAASLANEPSQKLARISLANYFAAALMMPAGQIMQAAEEVGYDVEVLSARFSASFEQVAHRLTTLAKSSTKNVPFFMVRIDNAGNVSKRFSSGSFPFAKFGGTCPLWNIHSTFQNPGRIETQIVELPDGTRWFSIARTVGRQVKPWGETEPQFVVGLGCEIKHAHRLIYSKGMDLKNINPTPIGLNCKLCNRKNCAQRAAPSLLTPLEINENIRGYSPFDSELRG